MLDLYAEDAEYVRVDRNNTPSSPMTLPGKEAIAEYYEMSSPGTRPTALKERSLGRTEPRLTGSASIRTA